MTRESPLEQAEPAAAGPVVDIPGTDAALGYDATASGLAGGTPPPPRPPSEMVEPARRLRRETAGDDDDEDTGH
jgi:hypothetical protein